MYYDQIDWVSLLPEDLRRLTEGETEQYFDWVIQYIAETYAAFDVAGMNRAVELFNNARLARLEPSEKQRATITRLLLNYLCDANVEHQSMDDVIHIILFCANQRSDLPLELDWRQLWGLITAVILEDTPCSANSQDCWRDYFDLARILSPYFRVEDQPGIFALARRYMNVRSPTSWAALLLYSHFIPRASSKYAVDAFHERQRARFQTRAEHPEYAPFLLEHRPKTRGEYLEPMYQAILSDTMGYLQYGGVSTSYCRMAVARVLSNLIEVPRLTWTRVDVETLLGWITHQHPFNLSACPHGEAITGGPQDTQRIAQQNQPQRERIWSCWHSQVPEWASMYEQSCGNAISRMLLRLLGRFRLAEDGCIEDRYAQRDVPPEHDLALISLRRTLDIILTFVRHGSRHQIQELQSGLSLVSQLATELPHTFLLTDPVIREELFQCSYVELLHGTEFIRSYGECYDPGGLGFPPLETQHALAADLINITLHSTRLNMRDFSISSTAMRDCLYVCPEYLVPVTRSLIRSVVQAGRKRLMMNALRALSLIVHCLIEAQGRGVILVDTERGGVILPVNLLAEVVQAIMPYVSVQYVNRLGLCCLIIRTIIIRCPMWDPTDPEDTQFREAWEKLVIYGDSEPAQSPSASNFCPNLLQLEDTPLSRAVTEAQKIEGHMPDTVLSNLDKVPPEQTALLSLSSPWPLLAPCPLRYTPDLHATWCSGMHDLCVAIQSSLSALARCAAEITPPPFHGDWQDLNVTSSDYNGYLGKDYQSLVYYIFIALPPHRARRFLKELIQAFITEERPGYADLLLSFISQIQRFAPLLILELAKPCLANIFEDEECRQMRPLTVHSALQLMFLGMTAPSLSEADYPSDPSELTVSQQLRFLYSGYEPTHEVLRSIADVRERAVKVYSSLWSRVLSRDDPSPRILAHAACSSLFCLRLRYNKPHLIEDMYQQPTEVFVSRAVQLHGWRTWAALPGHPLYLDESSVHEAESLKYRGLSTQEHGLYSGVSHTPEGMAYCSRVFASVKSMSVRLANMNIQFVEPRPMPKFALSFFPPYDSLVLQGTESVALIRNLGVCLRSIAVICQYKGYRVSEAEYIAAALKLHEAGETVDGRPALSLLKGPVAGAGLSVADMVDYPMLQPPDPIPRPAPTSELRIPLASQSQPGAPVICAPTLAVKSALTYHGGPRDQMAVRYVNEHKDILLEVDDSLLAPPGPYSPTPDVSVVAPFSPPDTVSYEDLCETDQPQGPREEFDLEDAREIVRLNKDEGRLQRQIGRLLLANITAVLAEQPSSLGLLSLVSDVTPFETSGHQPNDLSQAALMLDEVTQNTPYTIFRNHCSRTLVAARAVVQLRIRAILARRSIAYTQTQADSLRTMLHIVFSDCQYAVRSKAAHVVNVLVGNAPGVISQLVALSTSVLERLPHDYRGAMSSARYDDNLAMVLRSVSSFMEFCVLIFGSSLAYWRRLFSALHVLNLAQCTDLVNEFYESMLQVISTVRPDSLVMPQARAPQRLQYQPDEPIFSREFRVSSVLLAARESWKAEVERLGRDMEFYYQVDQVRRSSAGWSTIVCTFCPVVLPSLHGGVSLAIYREALQLLSSPSQLIRSVTMQTLSHIMSVSTPASIRMPATQLPSRMLELLAALAQAKDLTEAEMWDRIASLGVCDATSEQACDVEREEFVLATTFDRTNSLYSLLRPSRLHREIAGCGEDPRPDGAWLTTRAIAGELPEMIWQFPYKTSEAGLPDERYMGSATAHWRPPLETVTKNSPETSSTQGIHRTWLLGFLFNDEAEFPSGRGTSEQLAELILEQLEGEPFFHMGTDAGEYSYFLSPATVAPVVAEADEEESEPHTALSPNLVDADSAARGAPVGGERSPHSDQTSSGSSEISRLVVQLSANLSESSAHKGIIVQMLELMADDSMIPKICDEGALGYQTDFEWVWRRIVSAGGPRVLERALQLVARLAESHHAGHQRTLAEFFSGAVHGMRNWAAVLQVRFRGRLLALLETALFTGFSDPALDWCHAVANVYHNQDPRRLAWLSTALCAMNVRALTDETLPIAIRMRASAVECLVPLGPAAVTFCRPLIECLLQRQQLAQPISCLRTLRVGNMLVLFFQALRTQPANADGGGINSGAWLAHPLCTRLTEMLRDILHRWTDVEVRRRATEREHARDGGSARPPAELANAVEGCEISDADEESRLLDTAVFIVNRMILMGLTESLLPGLVAMLPDLLLLVRHPKAPLRFMVQSALVAFSHLVYPCSIATCAIDQLFDIAKNGYIVQPNSRLGWLVRGAALTCGAQLAFGNSHCVDIACVARRIVDLMQDASEDSSDAHAFIFLSRTSSCLSLLLQMMTQAECESVIPDGFEAFGHLTRCLVASAFILARPAVITPFQIQSLRVLTRCYSPTLDYSTGALIRDTINSWWALHEASWATDRAVLGEELAADILPVLADFSAFT